MKNRPSHLRVALRQRAASQYCPADQRPALFAAAVQLRSNPSIDSIKVAEALLGISDVPDETWHGPQPDEANGKDTLGGAIDRLSAEWTMTDLHRLVALRRVAWAAMQLARSIEKKLDALARDGDNVAPVVK